ncbi:SLAM family member 5-like isoform X9 [Siphateles boraxobius]|uniref:SLAM family member 5-like isoform X9 n=1 Tax=Siphateles boraxobius TaxID=180520 RepID=UPI00406462E9
MIHKSFFFCLWIWFSRGVFGAGTDEVKSVLVMEGDSVSLNTDVTEIQSTDQILWTYRHDSTEIRLAGIHKQNIDMYDSNVTFGDRLQMDSQTGSLTIRNIRTTDSGLYKLSIFSSNISYKRFNVMVYAPLQIPVITGISVLSSISVSDLSISLSLPLEVEYQDKNTYSCVINNPIRNQTTHLDITQACHTCKELMQPSHLVGIVVSSVILTVLVVAAIICFRSKSKQGTQKVQSCEEEVLYTETTFRARSVHSTKANGEDHIIYSSINVT